MMICVRVGQNPPGHPCLFLYRGLNPENPMYLKCCKLKIYWCYLCIFVIQVVIWLKGGPCRESMNEKSVSHTRIPEFSLGGPDLPAWKRPWQFFSHQLYIIHFTVIERRSGIRACPHSSEILISGGGILIYFYT